MNSKKKIILIFFYALIFIICTLGIGTALYLQYFQEQKIEIVFGFKDYEEEDEYNELKEEVKTMFTNEVFNFQDEELEVEKIKSDYNIVVTAYNYEINDENIYVKASIPYINIKRKIPMSFNQEIKNIYKNKIEEITDQNNINNEDYTVSYVSYIQDDTLFLIIRSEYRNGNNSQKATIKTYNYNFVEDRIVTLDEILNKKNISINSANNKIRDEIKKIQEQNQGLIDAGYSMYKRDYTSEIYKVEKIEQFFLGKEGMLYLIFAYGNMDDTNEMDTVIFK